MAPKPHPEELHAIVSGKKSVLDGVDVTLGPEGQPVFGLPRFKGVRTAKEIMDERHEATVQHMVDQIETYLHDQQHED